MSDEGVPMDDMWGGGASRPPHPVRPKSGQAAFHPSSQPTPPRKTRADVLDQWNQQRQVIPEPPKAKGWRALARAVGMNVAVEPPQVTHARNLDLVARGFHGAKTVTFANTKGGAGKTTLATLVAGAFGMNGPASVALMDNNPTGNLAARLDDVGVPYTIEDLVAQLDALEAPDTELNAVTAFMRYQRSGKFMALAARSRSVTLGPDGPIFSAPTISAEDFHRVHTRLRKVFNLILLDSGNNDADEQSRAALRVTDQLVIPIRWEEDSCSAAARLLASIETAGYERLCNEAIIVATHAPEHRPDPERAAKYGRQFEEWGNRVITIPPDEALKPKTPIRWDALNPATQAAAVGLAAQITTTW